nr:transglycosylase SLT domain-containing protein [Paeniglutamicibacter quisquiliarum]
MVHAQLRSHRTANCHSSGVKSSEPLTPVISEQEIKTDLPTSVSLTHQPVEPLLQVVPIQEVAVIQEPQATDIEQIVRQAARKYGLNEEHFLSIAMCESTMNPSAINYGYYENGHPSGLFQHLSGYYPARAAKAGYSTDVFDAYSNANTTAAMWSQGLSYLWECS